MQGDISSPPTKGNQCYSEDWTASGPSAFKRRMQAVGLSCENKPRMYDFGGIEFDDTAGVTIVIGSPTSFAGRTAHNGC
jgi:hypothetical protein